MTLLGWTQIVLFCLLVLALVRPLGGYMTRLFAGEPTLLSPALRPVERRLYRLAGVDPGVEQHWVTYGLAMLLFNAAGFLLLYALQRVQHLLPLNPQGLPAVPPDLAFNTAASFTTNTNWQAYGGETTLGYLVQMAGLTVQNFVSATTGIALSVALVRGFARTGRPTVGNFWADLVRATLYLLLPIAFVAALVLVWQGVPQNLDAYVAATTLEGTPQTIAQGPVASQEAVKMLGTNGGGFFNANSAHPYENPTPLTNLVETVLIFAIGAALTNVFGRMVGDERQGWAILGAMGVLFLMGVLVAYWAEVQGIAASALFAVVTTAASCGAVNAMHDSFMPLGGMIPLINMQLGEIIVGGVGAGLYGMLLFVIVAMFVAGLMVGRTPEYAGKKLEAKEVKMTMLAILCLPLAILGFTALAVVVGPGLAGIQDKGPHGFAEVLCLHLGHGQQRQRLCQPWRQLAVLQPDHRPCHADRPLRHDRADAGGGGLARGEAAHGALGRHAADARTPVRRPARRRDPDRRRAHLLPRPGARPGRRAPGDAGRHPVLIPGILF